MAIYTCLDMIADCRANRPQGWSYLVSNYTPVIRYFLNHYYAAREADQGLIERVVRTLANPGIGLYGSPGAATEREFVTMLRQEIFRAVELDKASAEPSVPLELETLSIALAPFTVTEKQFIWFESMAYSNEETAKILNLEPTTIEAARNRAEEALRQSMDHWRRGLFKENGLVLSRLATAAKTEDCLSPKAFLDSIDGRITWGRKKDYDFHMAKCWYCVDHFSRIREADFALSHSKPLTESEAQPFRELLALPAERKTLWKKMFS